MSLLIFLAPLLLLGWNAAAPTSDLVTSLPGQPQVPFRQYSGYVAIGRNSSKALFYYFVEAAKDHESKPLTLWLNGGPGCSSVGIGAFTELGPFYPDPVSNGLIKNRYAWNQVSNMLFVDSPVGVGWSYGTNVELLDDEKTSKDLVAFLNGWFIKFPEYRHTDLYLSGESYAGHYVPQLAARILDDNKAEHFKFNLKGLSLGNPLLDILIDASASYAFFWSRGAISDKTYERFHQSCAWRSYSDYRNRVQSCSHALDQAIAEYGKIDELDILLDSCLSEDNQINATMQQTILSRSMSGWRYGVDVCVSQRRDKYLNSLSVQQALHANTTGLPYAWEECSSQKRFLYKKEDTSIQIRPLLEHLLMKGLRVFLYSGDEDSRVPLLGTRSIATDIIDNLKLKTTVPYSSWYSNKQIGGWWQENGNLSFATIRGAGHMVPYSQPKRALTMFRAFVEGKQLPKH